jgi:cell division protein FtsI/penicillin-binding protein 2
MYTRAVMGQVAENMEAKIAESEKKSKKDITEWKYVMFGKSGTAKASPPAPPPKSGLRRPAGTPAYFERQYNTSFIAGAPLDNPKLVCLVVIDDPGPKRVNSNTYYGSLTAGPVVRRIMERSLTYLGVPPSPDKDQMGLPSIPMLHPPTHAENKKDEKTGKMQKPG